MMITRVAVYVAMIMTAVIGMDACPASAAVYPLPSDGGLIPVDVVPGGDYAGMDFSEADLADADLTGADCRGASFRYSDLSNATLIDVDLTGANLDDATLAGADLTGATIVGARFDDATTFGGLTQAQLESTASYASGDLRGVDFTHNRLSGWSFAGQNLTNARFSSTWLTETDFTGATITGAIFSHLTRGQLESTDSFASGQLGGISLGSRVDLSDCDFAGKDLTDFDFDSATLTGADFAGATIAGANLRLVEGFTQAQFQSTASYANGQLSRVSLMDRDLSDWDFAGQDLTDADFGWARLTRADFTGATIAGARFIESNLTRTQFESTASYASGDLRGLNLRDINASGWDFAGKDLTGVDFTDTYMRRADFTGAIIAGASFARTTDRGFTRTQFESTASYANDGLAGINLASNDLSDWDFAGKDLTDVRFISTTLTGADFAGAIIAGADFIHTTDGGFTRAQFESTANYANGQLAGVRLAENDLSGWDFAGKDLTGAHFWDATLTGADFTGASIAGTSFARTTDRGFTRAQFESTASYVTGRLAGVGLTGNDLSDWDFAGKDLTGAGFHDATLTGADLREAGQLSLKSAASTRNAILPLGQIEGLELLAGERLLVRDYTSDDLPITVDTRMSLDPNASLRMVFGDDLWGSTISFEPATEVTLDGTLELTLAAGAERAELLGHTFDLFDFEGVTAAGQFGQVTTEPGLAWDLSNLYTSGEVTLTAVPEPSTLLLLTIAAVGLLACGMRPNQR